MGNDESLCNAIQAVPKKFAIVSSLIDSRRVHLGRSMDVIAKLFGGIDPSQTEINRAGIDSLNGGPYGERVARVLGRLAIPSLTVIFSSESPSYMSQGVQFVSKGSLFGGREKTYSEIKGHLDKFFAGLENNK